MSAPTPPIPPALLALLASLQGDPQQHPFLGGQLAQGGQHMPFLGGMANLFERGQTMEPTPGRFRDVVEQMSPLVAAAASGHGAQLPDSGRIPDAVPANPYNPEPVSLPPQVNHPAQQFGGRQLPGGMYANGGITHRPGPGIHPGREHGGSQGGFMGPSQLPQPLEQLIARLRQQRPNVRYE